MSGENKCGGISEQENFSFICLFLCSEAASVVSLFFCVNIHAILNLLLERLFRNIVRKFYSSIKFLF